MAYLNFLQVRFQVFLKKLNLFSQLYFSYYTFSLITIIYIELIVLKNYVFHWKQEFFSLNFFFLHYTKVPIFLVLIFFFWIYVWSISIWRRTLFGRFTRGDRDLWAKALTSFWFAEFTTFFGFFFAILWCSWGPLPLFPRVMYFSRKSFFVEITIFCYIIWFVYYLKISMRTQLWKTQYFLAVIIVFLCIYLFWRNFIGLYTREVCGEYSQIKWKFVHRTAVVYSIDKLAWFHHYFGVKKNLETGFPSMTAVLESGGTLDPFLNIPNMITHEVMSYKKYMDAREFFVPATPVVPLLKSSAHYYLDLYSVRFSQGTSLYYSANNISTVKGLQFYPQRAGYQVKRYSAWQFLNLLKIWHTLSLLVWWLLFIYKLKVMKKSSYTLVHAGFFNIFCCVIMSFFVYYVSTLPYLECWLKMKYRYWTWTRVPYLLSFSYDCVRSAILPKWYFEYCENQLLYEYLHYSDPAYDIENF